MQSYVRFVITALCVVDVVHRRCIIDVAMPMIEIGVSCAVGPFVCHCHELWLDETT